MPVRSCFAEGSFTGLAAARPALPLHRRFASPPNWRRQVRRRPSVVGGTPPSLGRRSRGRRVGCATDRRHGGPPPRSPTWPSPVLWWLCAERQCADCGSAGDPALVSVLPSDGWLSPAACRRPLWRGAAACAATRLGPRTVDLGPIRADCKEPDTSVDLNNGSVDLNRVRPRHFDGQRYIPAVSLAAAGGR